jgi:hypothetical protein
MNQKDARHPTATQFPLDAERVAKDALQPFLELGNRALRCGNANLGGNSLVVPETVAGLTEVINRRRANASLAHDRVVGPLEARRSTHGFSDGTCRRSELLVRATVSVARALQSHCTTLGFDHAPETLRLSCARSGDFLISGVEGSPAF